MSTERLDCALVETLIGRYISGEELPEDLLEQVETHIGECESCAAFAREKEEALSAAPDDADTLDLDSLETREPALAAVEFEPAPEPEPKPEKAAKAKLKLPTLKLDGLLENKSLRIGLAATVGAICLIGGSFALRSFGPVAAEAEPQAHADEEGDWLDEAQHAEPHETVKSHEVKSENSDSLVAALDGLRSEAPPSDDPELPQLETLFGGTDEPKQEPEPEPEPEAPTTNEAEVVVAAPSAPVERPQSQPTRRANPTRRAQPRRTTSNTSSSRTRDPSKPVPVWGEDGQRIN